MQIDIYCHLIPPKLKDIMFERQKTIRELKTNVCLYDLDGRGGGLNYGRCRIGRLHDGRRDGRSNDGRGRTGRSNDGRGRIGRSNDGRRGGRVSCELRSRLCTGGRVSCELRSRLCTGGRVSCALRSRSCMGGGRT